MKPSDYTYIGRDGKAVLARELEDRLEDASAWIKDCTAKISNAIGGGSELFTRHGDECRLDVDFVCKRIREMRERQHEAMHRAIRAEREAKSAASNIAALEARVKELEEANKATVAAWEVLSEGQQSVRAVEKWLSDDMKPAIDGLRTALKGGR